MRALRGFAWGGSAALVLLAAGCATPRHDSTRDGVPEQVPAGLMQRPDAEPRIEAIRPGGPNKPYEAAGRSYKPVLEDLPMAESGGASWYGRKYHGRPTASGEPYDMFGMTAAHRTMPIPSYARVRNPANGAEVVVRINDRGPFAEGRVVDLSYTAALKLGLLGGVAPVEVRRVTNAEIRSGTVAAAPLPEPVPADRPAAAVQPGGGLWLQLGAFRQREGARALQQQVLREQPDAAVQVQEEGGLFRVRMGPFANRADAAQAAARLRAQGLAEPVLVSR